MGPVALNLTSARSGSPYSLRAFHTVFVTKARGAFTSVVQSPRSVAVHLAMTIQYSRILVEEGVLVASAHRGRKAASGNVRGRGSDL